MSFPLTNYPLTVGGCVVWADFADVGSIESSLGQVSAVKNKARSKITITQGTSANQPITGTRTLGGKNVLDFDGTNHFLEMNDVATEFTGEDVPVTVFVAGYLDEYTNAQNTMVGLGTSSGQAFTTFIYSSPADRISLSVRDDSITTKGGNSSFTYTPPFSHITAFDRAATGNLYRNGALATTPNIDLDVGVQTMNKGSIGCLTRTANQYFYNGTMGEVLIYKRILTTAERASIDRYLSQKWGIPLT